MKKTRSIYFFPLALVRLVLVLAVSAVMALAGLIWLRIFGFSRSLQRQVMRSWSRTMVFLCGVKVVKNSIPDSTHFILMSNHRSYIDIIVLGAFFPAAFVAKAEVRRWPLMKAASRLTGIIFVSRFRLDSLIAAMRQIKELVNRGIPVVLFPEGTTYRGPLTKTFKKGSFKIAADAKIPIIPAALFYEDPDDAWVGDDTFVGHFFRQMGKPVTRIHLKIGQPVTGGDTIQLRKKVREEIHSLLMQMVSRKKLPPKE